MTADLCRDTVLLNKVFDLTWFSEIIDRPSFINKNEIVIGSSSLYKTDNIFWYKVLRPIVYGKGF